MKLEVNIIYALVIGAVPAILIFMTMYKQLVSKTNEIKRLEKEALLLHNNILELEKEVVNTRTTQQDKVVVKMTTDKKNVAI